ncbi:hypothetical protein [Phenylobacterium sp.]|uniref:hypothetical protein n=1 Tax=Phenylobacterium sp. TaxID=1871053 RepID=UPI0025D25B84|nr:hypothetical protein [Phenylobacterium sp.]MCA3713969.1 hypothetical protein [Phenylobacterium sp.]
MSNRYRRFGTALGGLAVFAVVIGISFWVWEETSPRHPYVPAFQGPTSADPNYQPGGFKCDPRQVAKLPSARRLDETDRCRQAAEDHRIQQQQLAESVRANELTQRNLDLVFQQARASAAQSVFTFLAFVAAAIAAFYARIASRQAKRSADSDNAALAETMKSSDFSRILSQPYLYVVIEGDNCGSAFSEFNYLLGDELALEVEFSIKNYGKTPGIIKNINADIYIKKNTPYARPIIENHIPHEVVIGDGSKTEKFISRTTKGVSGEDIESIKSGDFTLQFAGFIEFYDIHGRLISTQFRWKYNFLLGKWIEVAVDPKRHGERAS